MRRLPKAQTQRTDLNLTIECGRRVERAVYEENRGTTLVPMRDRLGARLINGQRRHAAWTYEKQRFEAAVLRDIRSLTPVHDLDCPCDGCDLGDRSKV